MPLSAQAIDYTWTGAESNVWTNANNWSSDPDTDYPWRTTDRAWITTSTNSPVIIPSGYAFGLGGGGPALTVSGSANNDALHIQSSTTLGFRGTLTNYRTITLYGTMQSGASANLYIDGGGAISLQGGALYGNAGTWHLTSQNVSGYGTISTGQYGNLQFYAGNTITASASGQTLTVSGNILSSSNCDVNVGNVDPDNVTLALNTNLSARDLTLNQAGILNVATGNTITLTGNFSNNGVTPNQWLPAAGFNLAVNPALTNSTFEVGGFDYGEASTGFSNNFNLNTLTLNGVLQLWDANDNSGRGGAHGYQEVLYLTDLLGDGSGDVLDLNGLWCYVMKDGNPYALTDGLYHGVLVQNSPVPIPGSVILLGSGLLGLGLSRRRRR